MINEIVKSKDLTREKGIELFKASVEHQEGELMTIYLKTKLGDNIEVVIKKRAKDQVFYFASVISLFADEYEYYLDKVNHVISFEPRVFWLFYKHGVSCTQKLLKMVNVAKLLVNGEEYRFKTAEEYMLDRDMVVYGIYAKGFLIYVGSTVNKIDRWRTHVKNFEMRDKSSKMYSGADVEDIEFKVLEDEESLCEKWQKENGLSYQYFEIAELGYIETLKPLYNVCGVSREYLERVKIEIEDREELKEKIVKWVERNKEDIENLKRE